MQENFQIHAIKAFDDNYIWLIENGDQAVVIDAGSAQPVLDFLNNYSKENAGKTLTLAAILVTHDHHDHIGGIEALRAAFPSSTVYAHSHHKISADKTVDAGDVISCAGLSFQVWRTDGHTDCHLSYVLQGAPLRVFCGDTLFSAGCGRVFTGTVAALYDSFVRLGELPNDTLLYPAHEYTLANLHFARHILPNDTLLADYTAAMAAHLAAGKISLPTTVFEQKQINLFLQAAQGVNRALLARLVQDFDLQAMDNLSAFAKLRALKDAF